MARYKLKYPLSEKTCLPCAFGREVIDLSGNGYEKIVPASILGPEKIIKIRGANQKDLKALFESGAVHWVEKVEEPAKPVKAAKEKEGNNVDND